MIISSLPPGPAIVLGEKIPWLKGDARIEGGIIDVTTRGIRFPESGPYDDPAGECEIFCGGKFHDKAEKQKAGITPGLVRMSIGAENPYDLISNLTEVLKKISMPGFKKISMKQLEIVRPYLPNN